MTDQPSTPSRPAMPHDPGRLVLLRYRAGVTDETGRTPHFSFLFPPIEPAELLTALCGIALAPPEVEVVRPGHGIPCTLCALSLATNHLSDPPPALLPVPPETHPHPAAAQPASLPETAANYRDWGWPVEVRSDQIRLTLQPSLVAVMLRIELVEQIVTILRSRRCPPAVLIHPYAPQHRVLLAGERYGVALPWPAGIHPITGTLLLPPTSTPRGTVRWTEQPSPDSLRLTREIDLFAALRTACHPPTNHRCRLR